MGNFMASVSPDNCPSLFIFQANRDFTNISSSIIAKIIITMMMLTPRRE